MNYLCRNPYKSPLKMTATMVADPLTMRATNTQKTCPCMDVIVTCCPQSVPQKHEKEKRRWQPN